MWLLQNENVAIELLKYRVSFSDKILGWKCDKWVDICVAYRVCKGLAYVYGLLAILLTDLFTEVAVYR